MQYLINLRLSQIKMPALFPDAVKPAVPWLSEMMELKKEKNFFEAHVTEYQTGAKLTFESSSIDALLDWKPGDWSGHLGARP
jgi:ribonucleoside-diphosphate reductase beta chain